MRLRPNMSTAGSTPVVSCIAVFKAKSNEANRCPKYDGLNLYRPVALFCLIFLFTLSTQLLCGWYGEINICSSPHSLHARSCEHRTHKLGSIVGQQCAWCTALTEQLTNRCTGNRFAIGLA